MQTEHYSDSEDFYDCRDSFTENQPKFQCNTPPLLTKETVVRQLTNSSSQKNTVKIIDLNYMNNLPLARDLKKKHKSQFDFQNLRLIQELFLFKKEESDKWIIKCSPDGQFLIVAGRNLISIYKIYATFSEFPVLFKSTPTILNNSIGDISCVC